MTQLWIAKQASLSSIITMTYSDSHFDQIWPLALPTQSFELKSGWYCQTQFWETRRGLSTRPRAIKSRTILVLCLLSHLFGCYLLKNILWTVTLSPTELRFWASTKHYGRQFFADQWLLGQQRASPSCGVFLGKTISLQLLASLVKQSHRPCLSNSKKV